MTEGDSHGYHCYRCATELVNKNDAYNRQVQNIGLARLRVTKHGQLQIGNGFCRYQAPL